MMFDGPGEPDGDGHVQGPIYSFLSPTAHGTKWSMRHYTTAPDDAGLVNTLPSAAHTEMLLFYLGMAFIRASVLLTKRLGWVDLTENARRFWEMGPCHFDYDR